MTRQETAQILKLIKISYPHSFTRLGREDMTAMLNLWADSFKADDFAGVYKAARRYIMDGKFAPTIAEIREYMTDAAPSSGEYAAIEAAFAARYERAALGGGA